MEEFNFNPSRNLEKIKAVETNLFVKGATSIFRGFGDYVANYYDKNQINNEKLNSVLDIIDEYDKPLIGFREVDNQVSSGFLELKDGKIFFGEHYPQYTKFPESNRFYRQDIYSYIDNIDSNAQNAGKIFSAMQPFKQYPEKRLGGIDGKFQVSYEEKSSIEANNKLMEVLSNILESDNSDKKLIIKAFPEQNASLLGEDALQYPPVKTLLHVYDTLGEKQRQNFSLFFGSPKINWWVKKKVLVLLTNFEKKSTEEYYKEMGSVIVNWNDLT